MSCWNHRKWLVVQANTNAVKVTHQLCPPRRAPAPRCSLCWWAGRTDRSCPNFSQSTDSTVSQVRCTKDSDDHFYPLQSSPGDREAHCEIKYLWRIQTITQRHGAENVRLLFQSVQFGAENLILSGRRRHTGTANGNYLNQCLFPFREGGHCMSDCED